MSALWEKILRPALFRLDAETAHDLAFRALRMGLVSGQRPTWDRGPVKAFGMEFANPLGMAAGFDKNGLVVDQLAGLGFGFVEVGTVTLEPQQGNPRPRLFRLPADQALINRLGFNNAGAEAVRQNLLRSNRKCIIGVNIGKNRNVANEDAADNYVRTLEIVHEVADYIAVNVSSPNTPGLRDLQHEESLERLLTTLNERNAQLGRKPLLVKIAPDLDDDGLAGTVAAAMRAGVSGIIATNTTISRQGLKTPDPQQFGEGGVSGRPLTRRSTEVIARVHEISAGKLPIIGVGGVFSGIDARDKLDAGASLIQAYTGFVYRGPQFASEVLGELAASRLGKRLEG